LPRFSGKVVIDRDNEILLRSDDIFPFDHPAMSAAEGMEKLASGVYRMVITDARMENQNAGFEVVRGARRQAYNPAAALLTAYPPTGDHASTTEPSRCW
jgi:hypothetical protein